MQNKHSFLKNYKCTLDILDSTKIIRFVFSKFMLTKSIRLPLWLISLYFMYSQTIFAQTLSPASVLSDSLICAGEEITVKHTPEPDYSFYQVEAIDINNGFIYPLGNLYILPKKDNHLYISTESLLQLAQTSVFNVQISAFNYLGILLNRVILTQKLIVNPRPNVVLTYSTGQVLEYRTLGEYLSLNLIKLRGKLPFSFVIEDSIKVNMPIDTFTFAYDKRSNENFFLGDLRDANGCNNSIEHFSVGTYHDFETYIQISERRTTAELLKNKFFCKGEVLEARLKVKGVIPENLRFIPKYRYHNSPNWQELPVLLDSAGIYLIQLPLMIDEGTYKMSFFPDNPRYKTKVDSEHEDEFTVVEKISASIYSNGQIKVKKNETFYLKVLINKNKGNPTYINAYEVVLKTNFNKQIKLQLQNFENYVRIDTLTQTTTFYIASIKAKGKNNQSFELCEQAVLSGQVTVEVFEKSNKDIIITSLEVFRDQCGEGTFKVRYNVLGSVSNFDFKLQLKAINSSNQDETAYFDVPTTALGNNILEGILPNDTLFADYLIRIISNANNLYGSEFGRLSNYAHPPVFYLSGDAYVTASQSPVISIDNPRWYYDLDYYNISFSANETHWSYSSIRIDPKREITLEIPQDLILQQEFTILPAGASGGYCGKATLRGDAKIHIVPNSPIHLTLISSPSVCVGSKFYFTYNLSYVFTKKNTYRLRYSQVENPNLILYEHSISLSTEQGTGSYPVGGYNFEMNKDYYVYLVSDNPHAVSEPIIIHPRQRPFQLGGNTNWELLSSNILELNLNFSGIPPFKFKYFDGDFSRELMATSNNYTFRPYIDSLSSRNLFDSAYKIKITSLEDKYCVQDRPISFATFGYSLDKELASIIIFPPNKLEVCQGATVKLPFKKDKSVSNIVLQFYHPTEQIFYDLNTIVGVDTIVLNSIQNIPTDKPIYFRIKGIKENQTIFSTSTHNYVTFFSNAQVPTATVLPQTLAYKENVQNFNLKINFTGSAPWTLNYALNGQRKEITTYSNPYYLKLNTGYNVDSWVLTLNSVKNACGIGSATGTVNLIRANFDVSPETAYFTNFCQLSKADFTIVGLESFPNNTKLYFVSENLDRPDNVYEVPFIRKGGNLVQITIPENLPSGIDKSNPKIYKIRAVCNSPTLEGDFFHSYNNEIIKVNVWGRKPIVTVSGTQTIVKGDSAIITFSMDKYVEGTSYTFNNFTYDFSDKTYEMVVKPTKDTSFRLTSVNHPVCGAAVGNPSEAIITVRLCPLETDINSDAGIGISKKYQAEKIEAINKLNYQSRIEYNGERSILLKAGFESKQGSIFKAQIKPCVNENSP